MDGQDAPSPVAPLLRDVRLLATTETTQYGSIDAPRLVQDDDFPNPSWKRAWRDQRGRRFPKTIAHRGLNAKYPENSMAAFQAAVKVGAHALETDIHISKDDVVVLSHDADLKRCYGINKKIIDCEWSYLRTLRSTRQPREPLASFKELLEWLALPDQDHIWILLDIKTDNSPSKVMQLIAETITSVKPGTRPWSDRIVLGCWLAKFVPFCPQYLPGFPITHIGVTTAYAWQFFAVPNCSFNLLQRSLLGIFGRKFVRAAKAHERDLYAWTVNNSTMMKWCIQHELDGVITDDPQKFREICHSWRDDEPPASPTFFGWIFTFGIYILTTLLQFMIKIKYPENVQQYMARRAPDQQRSKEAYKARKWESVKA